MSKLDQNTWIVSLANVGKENASTPPNPPPNPEPIPEPIFEDYYEEDCHIFVANGNTVKLPIPAIEGDDCFAVYVSVDGVQVTPTFVDEGPYSSNRYWTVPANDGQTIYGIFDWFHINGFALDWFSDILQFGLNEQTGKRNQVLSGSGAFEGMIANPATIATLDTSNWTNAIQTFEDASNFNQDISGWDTSKVNLMTYMFEGATSFNQDISQWCVSLINEKPEGFDTNSGFAGDTAKQPQWGTCPGGENITLPHEYSIEDCHIFVTNSNPVNLPIPDGTTPIFVAVDGVEKDYDTQVKGNAFDGSTIHAIFDWENANYKSQNWYSDILQFGLNSETGKRNQLKDGRNAFTSMIGSPAIIPTLDVSNLTNMGDMFSDAQSFNQDISGWDTSKVTNMSGMFVVATSFNADISKWNTSNVTSMSRMFQEAYAFNQDISGWNTSKVEYMSFMFEGADLFNQDLSQWCVSKLPSKPMSFDDRSGFEGDTAKHPQWGTCPRGEDGA